MVVINPRSIDSGVEVKYLGEEGWRLWDMAVELWDHLWERH